MRPERFEKLGKPKKRKNLRWIGWMPSNLLIPGASPVIKVYEEEEAWEAHKKLILSEYKVFGPSLKFCELKAQMAEYIYNELDMLKIFHQKLRRLNAQNIEEEKN